MNKSILGEDQNQLQFTQLTILNKMEISKPAILDIAFFGQYFKISIACIH